MKILLSMALLLVTNIAFAVNLDIVNYLLDSEAAVRELQDANIQNIEFEEESRATTWTYTARVTWQEAGLGLDGPSTHPCTTIIKGTSHGGIAGTEFTEPTARTVCALNAPAFPQP